MGEYVIGVITFVVFGVLIYDAWLQDQEYKDD